MKKYLIISSILFSATTSFASNLLVDSERFEPRPSCTYSHSSSSSHTVVKEKSYEDFKSELTQEFRSRIVSTLKNKRSFSFLVNDEFKEKAYAHVRNTVRSAITVLGSSFFKAALIGMHEESINGFIKSMTDKWEFVELTDFQTDYKLKNSQRIFAHPEGLIVRFKKDKSASFSVYTEEDTNNVQAFIKEPKSDKSRRQLSSTFNRKAKAEACKLFVGYGKDLPFENDYKDTSVIVEPVPNSPQNSIGLRRFFGDDSYAAIPEDFRPSLQDHLDDMTMKLGHLKYTEGTLFPDRMQVDSYEHSGRTNKKRKRDESDNYYSEKYHPSKRLKRD